MKLRPEQLAGHLQRTFSPVYLIHGEEPLLVLEAADSVRHAARQHDYNERETFHIDSSFDWNRLLLATSSGSLFSTCRLLELRLDNGKPGDAGAKILIRYAAQPVADTVLLVVCGKLEGSSQNSRWFKALDSAGVSVQVWRPDGRRLLDWLTARLAAKNLQLSPTALALLAARVEGNLLAAAQEIDKLALLFGAGSVDEKQLLEVISHSARYTIYDLANAALAGRSERVVRILHGLRGEATEPVLTAWALTREIRSLSQLRFAIDAGQSVAAALSQQRIWEKRKPLFNRALQRCDGTRCQQLLRACASLDKIIKGVAPGAPWDALLGLALQLAGENIPSPTDPLLAN